MRRLVLIAGLLAAATALAMVTKTDIWHFENGVRIGKGTLVKKALSTTSSIDFAGGTTVCEDSSAITLTGVAANDPCVLGPPASLPSAGSSVFCYVSAADAVKVRHCMHGVVADPAAATYRVTVLKY